MAEFLENLKNLINNSPSEPGVYLFKKTKPNTNEKAQHSDYDILYIGKAKNLKNRLKSYINSSSSKKQKKIVEKADLVSWVVCDNEYEALLLESSLIKENRPPYNIIFRDDKNYIFLKIGTSADFPKVELVRRRFLGKTRDVYLGPYTNTFVLRRLVDFAQTIFTFATCSRVMPAGDDGFYTPKKNERECLLYHINKCKAPCIAKVNKKEYQENIKKVLRFFKGDLSDAKKVLSEKMAYMAKEKNFEGALKYKKIFSDLEEVEKKQKIIVKDSGASWDVIGLAVKNKVAAVTVFRIREGRIIDTQIFNLDNADEDNKVEVVEQFLLSYYTDTTLLPGEVYLPVNLSPDFDIVRQKLEEENIKIKFTTPKLGDKLRLVELASKNSFEELRIKKGGWETDENLANPGLKELQKVTGKELKRIECFDISHLSGTFPVASMVVFENGLPKKDHYRKFNLTSTKPSDDYAGMREGVSRRFNNYFALKGGSEGTESSDQEGQKSGYSNQEGISEESVGNTGNSRSEADPDSLKEEGHGKESVQNNNLADKKEKIEKKPKKDVSFAKMPDLLLIDGGKGQLSAVLEVLSNLFDNNPLPFAVWSIAKKEERYFKAPGGEEVFLDRHSDGSKLLQRVRDEAHRFGVTHVRGKNQKKIIASKLEDIPGIGPSTRKKLITAFGSLADIKTATMEEISFVVGVKNAQKIKEIIG